MLKLLISLAVVVGVCFAAPYPSYGPRDGSARAPVGVAVAPGSDYGGGYNRPYQNLLPGDPRGFPAGYPINAMQGGPYPGGYQGGGFNGYPGHGGGYDRRGEHGQQGFGYYGHQEFPRGHHHGYDHGRDHNYGPGYEYGRGY